jgi:hypothetical protein
MIVGNALVIGLSSFRFRSPARPENEAIFPWVKPFGPISQIGGGMLRLDTPDTLP